MRPERKHKRMIKRLEIEFSSKGSHFRSISSDISKSGLFVRTNRPFSPDTLVDLVLHLPDNMVSRITGRVRWAVKTGQASAKNGMGIEIIETDHTFDNYLNTLLPPGEQVQHADRSAAGPAASGAKRPSARAKSDPAAHPTGNQASEDDAIDSIITSLFSKQGRK